MGFIWAHLISWRVRGVEKGDGGIFWHLDRRCTVIAVVGVVVDDDAPGWVRGEIVGITNRANHQRAAPVPTGHEFLSK